MKLSERFREEFQTHVQSGPVGEFELINNQNIEACAEWVEAVEKRLLKIATDAREEIVSPSFDVSARALSRLLGRVLREIEEVAEGEV